MNKTLVQSPLFNFYDSSYLNFQTQVRLELQFDCNHFKHKWMSGAQRYTIEQRVWTAIWFEESKSVTDVCRRYRSRFGRNMQAPQRALIIRWHENLFQHGNVLHRISGSGRPRLVCTEENKEAVATAFTRSPKKLIRMTFLIIRQMGKKSAPCLILGPGFGKTAN